MDSSTCFRVLKDPARREYGYLTEGAWKRFKSYFEALWAGEGLVFTEAGATAGALVGCNGFVSGNWVGEEGVAFTDSEADTGALIGSWGFSGDKVVSLTFEVSCFWGCNAGSFFTGCEGLLRIICFLNRYVSIGRSPFCQSRPTPFLARLEQVISLRWTHYSRINTFPK